MERRAADPAAAAAGDLTKAFAGITAWIFDLDDTLYPNATGIDAELRRRIRLYLRHRFGIGLEEAETLHRGYVERFGTTLQALLELHGEVPADFLPFVHDIDLTCLRPDAGLAAALAALPGRRLVFTNGSQRHAESVLEALHLADLFDGIFHIESGRFVGKPSPSAYDAFLSAFGIEPTVAAMFEDRAANLAVPRRLGMRTVLVLPPADAAPEPASAEAADFLTDDLPAFLRRAVTSPL